MKSLKSALMRIVLPFAGLMLTWVGMTQAQEVRNYFVMDPQGSPIIATDAYANVVWSEDYLPYGERRYRSVSSGDNERWFTGASQNEDTGLVDLGNRKYDPVTGRFLSTDPIGASPEKPFSVNRYAYANNNPYKFTDPSGLEGGCVNTGTCENLDFQPSASTAKVLNSLSNGLDYFDQEIALPMIGATPVGMMEHGAEAILVAGLRGVAAAAKTEAVSVRLVKEITLSRALHGEAAEHAADAIKAGKPNVLTIDRSMAPANRQASIGALDKVPGKHLDEYPPAMFKEGGTGASVRPINPRDNMSAGACIGNACRGLPDGARVRINVGD